MYTGVFVGLAHQFVADGLVNAKYCYVHGSVHFLLTRTVDGANNYSSFIHYYTVRIYMAPIQGTCSE